jgi:hypothetical protein
MGRDFLLFQELRGCAQDLSGAGFLQEYDEPLLFEVKAFFDRNGELELGSGWGNGPALAQATGDRYMIELSTRILATANLRLGRIVGHRNKKIGAFAALRQRSSLNAHIEVLIVFAFGRDVQRSSISGSGGVQGCLKSGRIVTYQLLGPVYHHLGGEWTV